MNVFNFKRIRTGAVGLLIAIFAAFFLIIPVAYAALYNISTTDNSVSDWDPVPVFQTDPEGDWPDAGQDIVEAKVASMDTTDNGVGDFIHFLVKTSSDAGLGEMGRVAASIDCNNNGVFEEFDDRLVLFNPEAGSLIILHGTRFGQAVLIPPDAQQGQKVGQYYEWGVAIDDLFPFVDDTPGLPDNHCQGIVGIEFQTFKAGFIRPDDGVFVPPEIYDTTEAGPYAMFNIPTAVSIHSIGVSGGSGHAVLLLAVASLAVGGTAIGLKRAYRRIR